MKQQIRRLVEAAIARCIDEGVLPCEAMERAVEVTSPPRPELGDFSTNAALLAAKLARRPPMEIAEAIVSRLDEHRYVREVEIVKPGFINFRLSPEWLAEAVAKCLGEGSAYGRATWGAGKKVQVEFVSANPVGPIHIGNARGGPFGDVLASLLEATGHDVTREYYINDGPENTQVRIFGASLQARYLQLIGEDVPLPEEGYQAEYVGELARELVAKHGDELRDIPVSEEGALRFFALVRDTMVEMLRDDCAAMGIEFDVWFSEQALVESGKVQQALASLAERGATYERDGAVWLRSKEFGDDEDRVLQRSSGATTYIASDAAYAMNKFIERGFEHVVYVWGPDHAGYIPRLKAAIAALGIDPDRAEVIIYQTVRLVRGGQTVKLSKRHGRIVPIREIVEEVGRDATRFFFLMRSVDAHLDFDLDLARSQSEENPVYYVQYAHARICSIKREAQARGFAETQRPDLSLLTHPAELELMRFVADYPELVSGAARDRAPHRLTHFAIDLARCFHQFYDRCRVLDEENMEMSRARLALVRAVGQVLRNLLGLLGVEAPEKM